MTAALGLAVAFVAVDLLLFNVLRVSLTRSVDDTARQGAAGVVALIDANRLPTPVPVAPDVTIQVLDSVRPDHRRLPGHRPPGAAAQPGAGGGERAQRRAPRCINGPAFGMPSLLRVTAVRAADGSLVIAAVPYSSVSGSLSVVAKALVFGTPLLFLLFTGAIWLAVGSTLRPIDLLRRGAARVTGTAVPSDLPVPEARDEVRSLALTLNDMLDRLAAAQQRQRALVSDTAHELRSPIASIRAQLEVALDHPEGQDWEATARDVHADVLRLARLAEDLLLLARLDERAGAVGQPARGTGTVDLAELSESVVARYAGARVPVVFAGRAEARPEASSGLDATDAATPYLVTGDRDAIDRLLVNLIDNAVRYAKSQVTVDDRAARTRGSCSP